MRSCVLYRVRIVPCRAADAAVATAAAMDSTMVMSSQVPFGEGKGAMIGRAAAVDWPMQLSLEARPQATAAPASASTHGVP